MVGNSGVLFSRSVRSTFASFCLAVSKEDAKEIDPKSNNLEIIIVRAQFFEKVSEIRSACRRLFRLGDRVSLVGGAWEDVTENNEEISEKEANDTDWSWRQLRFVVNVQSQDELRSLVTVQQAQYWNMTKCQGWQRKLYSNKENQNKKGKEKNPQENILQEHEISEADVGANEDGPSKGSDSSGHTSNLPKRVQGEYIANFLVNAIMFKLSQQENKVCGSSSSPPVPDTTSIWAALDAKTCNPELLSKALAFLNYGSGVIDAAGGSGHVSMALGMMGIQSTVVDARPSVGKLPGRDRKIYHRALKQRTAAASSGIGTETETKEETYCRPVVPFRSLRAWFGYKPDGIDASFRLPDDQQNIPVCDELQDLWQNSSAIVALHPDEATGAVVDMAVQKRIPFVVVPCCVFCRLFPKRFKFEGDGSSVVSTYDELLDYLQSKDKTIQRVELPFQGKNTALWSIF